MRFIIRFIRRMIMLAIALCIFTGLYSAYIEPKLLICRNYSINVNKERKNVLKVVQFTDTHLGEFFSLEDLQKVVEKINKQNADIVVFTGDLMDNAIEYGYRDDISGILKEIKASKGKYAIYGNRDYGGEAVRFYKTIMNDSGFKLLVNESININLGNKNLTIFGGDDSLMGKFNSSRTIKGVKDGNINLLLIHEPDLADDFKDYSLDLILAGHSHGGQVYIPFYGPIRETALAEKYRKGMYNIDNERKTKLYVSSGLGSTKVPLRLLNIPEVSVFKIKY